MNTARIVVLAIAVGAGGIAAYPNRRKRCPARAGAARSRWPLRSIADLNAVDIRSDDQAPRRGDSVNVVRFGIASQTTTQK